jgi:hypothetical protein
MCSNSHAILDLRINPFMDVLAVFNAVTVNIIATPIMTERATLSSLIYYWHKILIGAVKRDFIP